MSASISSKCTLSTATFGFGSYDTTSATDLTTSSGSVILSCTRGAPGVTIQLDNGLYSSHAVGTTRAMANGTNYLSYDFYTDNGYGTVWNSVHTVTYTSITMASTPISVYGKIPHQQDAAIGSYSDTVMATVNY